MINNTRSVLTLMCVTLRASGVLALSLVLTVTSRYFMSNTKDGVPNIMRYALKY